MSSSKVASQQNHWDNEESSTRDAERTPLIVEETGNIHEFIISIGETDSKMIAGSDVTEPSTIDDRCRTTEKHCRMKMGDCCPSAVLTPTNINSSNCSTDVSVIGVKVRATGQSRASSPSSPKAKSVRYETPYSDVRDESTHRTASFNTCPLSNSVDYRPLPASTEMTVDEGVTSSKTILYDGKLAKHDVVQPEPIACGNSACDVRLEESVVVKGAAKDSRNIIDDPAVDLLFQWLDR